MEAERMAGGVGTPLFPCPVSFALDQMDAFHGEEQTSYKVITHKVEISCIHSLIISTYLSCLLTYDLIFLSGHPGASSRQHQKPSTHSAELDPRMVCAPVSPRGSRHLPSPQGLIHRPLG